MKNFRHRHSRLRGNGDMASFFGCTVSLNLIRCQTAKGHLKTRSGFSDGLLPFDSGLNVNRDKAEQRRTGLNLIRY